MVKDRRLHNTVINDGHAEKRYRATFHQAAIGIAHTTADSTLLDVNPALSAMLGYARDELLRMRLADLRSPSENSTGPVEAAVGRLLSGEIRAHASTEQYCHKSGAAVWVQRTVSVASRSGQPYLIHF